MSHVLLKYHIYIILNFSLKNQSKNYYYNHGNNINNHKEQTQVT